MTQIKLRRDTSANFTSKNPVLGIGEPAYETDTKKLKIGDGTTAYNSLSYFSMTDEFATYREKYGAPSDSVPVVNTGNSITIKANVNIETPNGTLTNATDMTYTYDFLADRVLFATENDYYHAYAVYYGGREPSPVGEQIFWFNNNVWTMISGNGTKTVFNTQKITPIAKIYQVNGTVKNIDYSSYTKTSTGGGGSADIGAALPLKIVNGVISLEVDGQTIQVVDGKLAASANMVTTDTAQTITGLKTFGGTDLSKILLEGSSSLIGFRQNIDSLPTTLIGGFFDSNGKKSITIGSTDHETLSLNAKSVQDGSGNKFLTSGNVAVGNGVNIIDTTDGIQISATGSAGMPSNRYIDLTLGASNSTYTAPANGFIYIAKFATGGQYMAIRNYGTDGKEVKVGTQVSNTSSNQYVELYIPVKKEDIVRVSYNLGGDTGAFRFVYAEGEV